MNFLYALYFALPNFARLGLPGKAINRILGMTLKRMLDLFMPWYLKRTGEKAGFGLNTGKRDETYIVSLTSFPARIEDIWITIETLLRQSFKPDKIILWLGEEKFPGKKLPEKLERLKDRGLTIEFVEDLRSHTKYFHALKKFPDANIITLDDDSYYPRNTLLHLVNLHKKHPNAICANRVHKITFKNGEVKPYRKWNPNFKKEIKPSHFLLQTGVGGVLYPPGALNKELFDKDVFKELCNFADDLWLKIHALRNGTKVVTSKKHNKDLITVSKSQRQKLVTNNVLSGGNDDQLKNVLDHYGIQLKDEIEKLEQQSC